MKRFSSSLRFASLAAAAYLSTLMLTETAGLAEAATFRFPGNICRTKDDDNDSQYHGFFVAQSDNQQVWCAIPSGPDLALANVSSVTIYGFEGNDSITSRTCVTNTIGLTSCGGYSYWHTSDSLDVSPFHDNPSGYAYVYSQDVDKTGGVVGIKVNTQ